jgi:hypothetical protein
MELGDPASSLQILEIINEKNNFYYNFFTADRIYASGSKQTGWRTFHSELVTLLSCHAGCVGGLFYKCG